MMDRVSRRGIVSLCLTKAIDNGITTSALQRAPGTIHETNAYARAAIETVGIRPALLSVSIVTILAVVIVAELVDDVGYPMGRAVTYWSVAYVWLFVSVYNAVLYASV